MKKTLFIVVGILILGYVYLKFIKPPKNDQIKFLMQNNYTTGTINQLTTLGDDYIFTWYRAAKKGLVTFTYDGKQYRTQGGTKI
jgi:uncharacterized protein YxeA